MVRILNISTQGASDMLAIRVTGKIYKNCISKGTDSNSKSLNWEQCKNTGIKLVTLELSLSLPICAHSRFRVFFSLFISRITLLCLS